MKIMQVIPCFCFGGAETMCENLTYALKAQGQDVVVVSLYPQHTPIAQRMEAAGVQILYLDKKLGLDLSMIPKLRRLMAQQKPDVVHTHLNVVKYAVPAAKLAGVKTCVHTIHNVADQESTDPVHGLLCRMFYHLGWLVPVALSGLVQQTVLSHYHLKPHQVPVIFNGIDLGKCRSKTGYALGETVTLLHIGRFQEQKNHRCLLEMFRQLHEQFPQCRLQLLGDGELRQEMEQLAQQLGIAQWVEFLGLQGDVHPFLEQADLFVLPSRYEGMPMTLIEAMATGLPIVASQVGGVGDMLKGEQSALLTEPEENQLLQACQRLLEDESLRQRLGRQALADSVRFSADAMAQQYLLAYQGR